MVFTTRCTPLPPDSPVAAPPNSLSRLRLKAIGRNKVTESRRISVHIQGTPAGAKQGYVTAGATQKTGEKTSKTVSFLREIA
jgi:hypothetical protein